jgi:hypothetical protein
MRHDDTIASLALAHSSITHLARRLKMKKHKINKRRKAARMQVKKAK